MFSLLQILIQDFFIGLFENQRGRRKKISEMVIGGISCVGCGVLGFYFYRPVDVLDQELVRVSGVVAWARNEKGHKHDVDLLVAMKNSEIRMKSDSPYPSKFRFGSRTPDVLKEGQDIEFILNRSEMEGAPRKHRFQGYEWREFVGMSSSGVVHLTPKNHERWHEENHKLGRIMLPIFAALGLVLFVYGWRGIGVKKSKRKQRISR